MKYLLSAGQVQLLRNGNVVDTFAFNELSADSGDGLALFQRGEISIPFTDVSLPEKVLELHVPSIDGVPLSYTRFGTYAEVNLNIFNINSSSINPLLAFTFGQPTESSAMPTGDATYNVDLLGTVVVPDGTNTAYYTLGDGHGSAEFSVNFTSGDILTAIQLGADGRDFGSLTGTGSIVSSGPAFNGTLTGDATGAFTGSFFGPDAAEMGYVFQGQGNDGNDDFLTYGNVYGIRESTGP